MEVRARTHRQRSPEKGARVLSDPPSQRPQQSRKVSVVYYLCRNRHLEHPHFIEVPLSSPQGLYLRDVTDRLTVLRGKGMAAMYSWSCKRSYKNGFVWHDISEDDLILPAHGEEYVLKGSELLADLPSGRISDISSAKKQNQKVVHDTSSSRGLEVSSSSSSISERPIESSQQEQLSPPLGRSGSSEISPELRNSPLTEYKVYKPDRAANASTQTDDGERRVQSRDTCTRGVSTDEGLSDIECKHSNHQNLFQEKDSPEIGQGEILPSPPSSSGNSSGGKTETLETLIRADVNKMRSFRILEEEQVLAPSPTKLKASNVLMQLITCGSIAVKDHHSFGLVPTYRPKFINFPSPTFSSSTALGELDWLPDNRKLMGLRLEDKEYFSGSLIETGKHKGDGEVCTLKRSSSYNAERTSRLSDSTSLKEEDGDSLLSKCIPLNLKNSSNKQVKTEPKTSPLTEKARNSIRNNCTEAIPVGASDASSKRATNPSNAKGSKRLESGKVEKEKSIKIEERLASGARVIIQLKAPKDEIEESWDE